MLYRSIRPDRVTYSDLKSANKIQEFYDKCRKNDGIVYSVFNDFSHD